MRKFLFLVSALIVSIPIRLEAVDNCSGQNCPGNPFGCCSDGNCTWWGYCQRSDLYPSCNGYAWEWYGEAQGASIPTGNNPAVGSIAYFDASSKPDYGHVAYVQRIFLDGSYEVSEMGCESWSGVQIHTYQPGEEDGFIYGGPVGNGPNRGGKYISQSPADPTGVLSLQPNETVACSFVFRDTGNVPWCGIEGNQFYVELRAVASNWTSTDANNPLLDPARVKLAVTSGAVDPNGEGLFTFNIHTPSTPGRYDLRVRLYHTASQTYISPTGTTVPVQVVAPDPPLLSGTSFTPLVADFNADGKDDICLYAPASGNWYVAFSNGTDAFTPTPSATGLWMSNWKSTGGPYTPFAADFSGDGYADIALMRQSIGRWYVAFNWNDHFTQANGTATDNSWLADGWGESPYISMVADMSSDGYPDVCLYHPTYGRWFVAYNWNDHFIGVAGPYDGGSWLTNWKTTGGTYLPFAAELSGDGYTDVALLRTSVGRWYVGFNDATPTPPDLYQANGTATDNSWLADGWGESPYIPFIRDFSGDGFADVCLFHPTLGRWFVAFNWNNHFAGAAGPYTGGSWIDNWKTSASGTFIPLVGDFSGDGYTDICLYEPSTGKWHVAFNWNDRFTQANGTYDGAWLDGWGVVTGGGGKLVGNSNDDSGELPETFFLSQNYPNPFNPVTNISYSLSKQSHVTIEVYNILGQRVALLVNDDLPAGNHTSVWNADKQASGIYFYRLQTEEADVTKKMLLLK